MKLLDQLFFFLNEILRKRNYEGDSFPIVTLGLMSTIFTFDLLMMFIILDILSIIDSDYYMYEPRIWAYGFIFVFLLILYFSPKKKYLRIYYFYKEKKLSQNSRSQMIFYLFIGMSAVLPIVALIIKFVILKLI